MLQTGSRVTEKRNCRSRGTSPNQAGSLLVFRRPIKFQHHLASFAAEQPLFARPYIHIRDLSAILSYMS